MAVDTAKPLNLPLESKYEPDTSPDQRDTITILAARTIAGQVVC